MATEEQQPCLKEGDNDKEEDKEGVEENADDKHSDDKKDTDEKEKDTQNSQHQHYKKKNGDVNKDYAHSNGVKSGRSGSVGEGGGDGPRKRNVTKQNSNDNTPISPEELEKYIPEPPDGGWGWVIVVASIINNLIVDGLCYTFGVFLTEFMQEFNASSTKVSLVGSLTCGIYLFAGPIVSAMTNKFGCRPVVCTGGVIAFLAFVLATRAPNIDVLILTYGVMGGFGLGMVYLPSIVSVGYYFQAKRAFATGLAVAGSGLGTFIFPPLCEFLLQHFSWRGALLLVSGIVFNACVAGALMRPLEAKRPKPKVASCNHQQPRKKRAWDRVQEYFRGRTQSESTNDEIAAKVREAKLKREKKLQETDSVLGSVPSVTFKRLDSASTADGKAILDAHKKKAEEESSPQGSQPSSPTITIELENEHGSKVTEEITILDAPKSQDSKDGKDQTKSNKSPSHPKTFTSQQLHSSSGRGSDLSPLLNVPGGGGGGAGAVLPPGCGGSRSNLYNLSSMRSLNVSKKNLQKDLARPLYRKDIFYSASVLNIPQYQSQTDVKSYIASITTLPGERDFLDNGPTASSKCVNSCCFCLPRSFKDVLGEMVDVSLFKDTSFMLICLGNFLAFLGFFVPFVFLVDKAVDVGIEKSDAAFLISIIGITNTVGRVAVGKLVDMKILDSLVVTYSAIAVCGVVTALTPFCNVYSLLALNAALFGTGMAAFVSLSSIIICDRMGVEKLTNAFGLMSMTRGLSGMIGPPLGGQLYEMTKNYNLSFYVAGIFLVSGAVCHMFLHLPCLRPKGVMQNMPEVTMEEVDPEEYGLTPVGGKEQPHIITVDDISNE